MLPKADEIADATVTVIVPTLNEAQRIAPCLEGLMRQALPLAEVIIVDGQSTDPTAAIVRSATHRDARIRLEPEPPLPPGWLGKVWALQHGLSIARGEWMLGLDADTEPEEGMVAGVVDAARKAGYQLVSFSPKFAGQTAAERLIQPSLLATLVYRCGAPGVATAPEQTMANGQCFLAKRDILLQHGGYEPARASFCDDVSLARYYAGVGVKVGFLDGAQLYRVRSYESLRQMWREWGRSIDLSAATAPGRQWADVAMLSLAQGLPVPLLLAAGVGSWIPSGVWPTALLVLNLLLLAMHFAVRAALRSAYERRGVTYWLSVASDPLAVLRVLLSTLRRPRTWRGRVYAQR